MKRGDNCPACCVIGLDLKAKERSNNNEETLATVAEPVVTTYHQGLQGIERVFAYHERLDTYVLIKCRAFVSMLASAQLYVLAVLVIMSSILFAGILIEIQNNVQINDDTSVYYPQFDYQYLEDSIEDKNKKMLTKERETIKYQLLDLKEQYDELLTTVHNYQLTSMAEIRAAKSKVESFQQLIRRQIDIYDEEKLGFADFASESMGGRIISTPDTITYHKHPPYYLLNVIPVRPLISTNSPEKLINPLMEPGSCWAFKGTKGNVLIQLPVPIYVKAVTVSHVSPKLVPSGRIDSAPKEFIVYGVNGEEKTTESKKLGNFTFRREDHHRQTFPINQTLNVSFSRVMLKIISNHGHKEFTCVYNFQVHGKVDSESELIY